jgi:hypothetical protein
VRQLTLGAALDCIALAAATSGIVKSPVSAPLGRRDSRSMPWKSGI